MTIFRGIDGNAGPWQPVWSSRTSSGQGKPGPSERTRWDARPLEGAENHGEAAGAENHGEALEGGATGAEKHELLRLQAGELCTAEFAKAKGMLTNALHRAAPRRNAFRRRSEEAEGAMDRAKKRAEEAQQRKGGERFFSDGLRFAGRCPVPP